MGTHEGWLTVKSSAHADVVSAVIASYTSRGAKLVDREKHAELARGTPMKKPARLGVAVLRPAKGWIQIVDSFGYTSDLRLARDLAEALEVTVFRSTTSDVADYAALERLGPLEPPASLPSEPARYQDEKGAKTVWLTFTGVDEKRYEQGPALALEVQCKSCRRKQPWSPGFELPTEPHAEALVHLAEVTGKPAKRADAAKKKSDVLEGKLVFVMRCNECDTPLGWAVAEVVCGLVVEVTRLTKAPTKRGDFDFALEKQSEEIERALPSAETRAAKASAATLEKRFAKTPRGALMAAHDKLVPTLKKTRVPLVSLRFASDRDALVATLERDFAAFAWKPIDLPGNVALQIVAWLGPKPNAPALMAFLGTFKKLLSPGAFARQGRDPKTLEWMTAVCTPTPTGDWAALLLFDQYRSL